MARKLEPSGAPGDLDTSCTLGKNAPMTPIEPGKKIRSRSENEVKNWRGDGRVFTCSIARGGSEKTICVVCCALRIAYVILTASILMERLIKKISRQS